MENLIRSPLRLEKLRADAYEMRFADHDLRALARQAWTDERFAPTLTTFIAPLLRLAGAGENGQSHK